MLDIRLAKNSGFCFGVKRAIRLAEETSEKYGKATTIGPIIHNPQMVEKLSRVGVKAVDDIYQITESPVIIRSHGITQENLTILKDKNLEIVDATCPYVARAHEYAISADEENYHIIILGNPTHPEIIALKSRIHSNVQIWDSIEYIEKKEYTKVAVICQTTQNIENLHKLTSLLLPITKELRVFNTICDATNIRQSSSLALATATDLMIVIGGKNSSNTLMLAKLCSELTTTKHIEAANEISKVWFDEVIQKKGCIGLTAGASTPDWIILEIYNKIKAIVGYPNDFAQSIDEIPSYNEEPL